MVGPLGRHGASQVIHPTLCAAVRSAARRADDTGLGGNVDDTATLPLLDHLVGRDLTTEKHVLEVRIDDLVVKRFVVIEYRLLLIEPGIVDERIDPAVVVDDSGDERADRIDFHYIEHMGETRATIGSDLGGQRFELIHRTTARGDLGPGLVGIPRNRAADSPSRTGNDDDLVG